MDCPDKLTTGVSLIVSIEVYLLTAAFKPISVQGKDEKANPFFNEGSETSEESILRERKTAVVRLFDIVGLRPHAGVNAKGQKTQAQITKEVSESSKPKKKVKEIVGDGEEIEVDEDDAEKLADEDLDMIYKKFAAVIISNPNDMTDAVRIEGHSTMIKVWVKWNLLSLLSWSYMCIKNKH